MKTCLLKIGVLGAALLATGLSAQAQTNVYNDSGTFSGSYFPSSTEFGDQISYGAAALQGGSVTTITDFKFEYYSSLISTAGKSAQIRFYANTGANGAPGATPVYTSPSFSIGNGFNSVDISGLNIAANANGIGTGMTWTILFSGLTAGEQAGLNIYETPSNGLSNNDFWQKDNTGAWALKQISGGSPKANFAAQVFGIVAVPEPSSVQLVGAVALLGLGFAGYRRLSMKHS